MRAQWTASVGAPVALGRTALLVGVGTVAVVAVATGFPLALRAVLVAGFVGLGPGLAFAWRLRLEDALTRAVVAVAGSLAVATIGTEALALAHTWQPDALLVGLVVLAAAVCRVPLRRHRPPAAVKRPQTSEEPA